MKKLVLCFSASSFLSSSEPIALFTNLIRPQPFQPKLHMTDADFLSITRNGELCDEDGGLGTREFELVMREQV